MVTRREFLAAALAAQTGARPNVVVILCDDLGYSDLGCYGSKIRTPNLDRMAHEGMRFTNALSANPVCSPSRAALLTGRYPTRVGVPQVLFPMDQEGLNLDEKTLADLLKARGYRTACYGKWHLGHTARYLPTSRGFDSYFGIPYSNDMTPTTVLENTRVVEEEANQGTLTQRYTGHAVRFIEESKSSPFFLYMPHTFPHIPLHASTRFRGKSPLGLYGDVVEEIDWSVGEVFGALRRTGQERNTLVVFSSDNGPWYQGSAAPLRGRKGMTWEGGVREPFIAWMPGRIPQGRTSEAVVSLMDVLPTAVSLTGAAKPEKPLDGVDLWPLLTGGRGTLEREPLLYFWGMNLMAARWGPWKLHIARDNAETYSPAPAAGREALRLPHPELYNLELDPAESYDVAAENPAVARRILDSMTAQMKTFPADIRQVYEETAGKPVRATPAGAYPQRGKP
jgi:arylsulfatase A